MRNMVAECLGALANVDPPKVFAALAAQAEGEDGMGAVDVWYDKVLLYCCVTCLCVCVCLSACRDVDPVRHAQRRRSHNTTYPAHITTGADQHTRWTVATALKYSMYVFTLTTHVCSLHSLHVRLSVRLSVCLSVLSIHPQTPPLSPPPKTQPQHKNNRSTTSGAGTGPSSSAAAAASTLAGVGGAARGANRAAAYLMEHKELLQVKKMCVSVCVCRSICMCI